MGADAAAVCIAKFSGFLEVLGVREGDGNGFEVDLLVTNLTPRKLFYYGSGNDWPICSALQQIYGKWIKKPYRSYCAFASGLISLSPGEEFIFSRSFSSTNPLRMGMLVRTGEEIELFWRKQNEIWSAPFKSPKKDILAVE